MAPSSTSQLREFIAKFDPVNQKLIRAARKELRERFPGAYELVYDNYNFFVIGYSAKTGHGRVIVRSISAKQRPRRKPSA